MMFSRLGLVVGVVSGVGYGVVFVSKVGFVYRF